MTQQYNNNFDREFDWNDTIQNDSPEFVVLDPGEYWFTVESFERARHNGSDKLPPCNKAIVKVKIETNQGEAYINHNLFLHSKTEGMLSAFFGSIGQKKHGEALNMNWQTVPGAIGVCKVKNKTYNGNVYNEIQNMIYQEDVDFTKQLNLRPGAPVYQQPQQPVQPQYQAPIQQTMQNQMPPQQQGFQAGQF